LSVSQRALSDSGVDIMHVCMCEWVFGQADASIDRSDVETFRSTKLGTHVAKDSQTDTFALAFLFIWPCSWLLHLVIISGRH
jgi:hypothetical protein